MVSVDVHKTNGNHSINARLDMLIKETRLTNVLLAALLKPVTVIAW